MPRLLASSLLASTSLLALALAGPVARAGDYVIPSGTVVTAPVVVNTTTPGAPFGSVINLGGITYAETTKNSTVALEVNATAVSDGVQNAGTITVTQTLAKLDIHGGGTQPTATGVTKAIVLYGSGPLSGKLENTGSLTVSRIVNAAPVIKTTSAVAIGEYAEGLHVETYLAGGIVNASTGIIDVSDNITAVLAPSDSISTMLPVTVIHATGIVSEATGIANNITNAGSITAQARGAITEQVIRSSAASLLASATARAVGIQMTPTGLVGPAPSSPVAVVNSGIIDVVASVTQTTTFTISNSAHVDPGRLIQSLAGAIAIGVDTVGAEIGSFQNTGHINVSGTAVTASTGSVSALSTAALLNFNDPKSPKTFPEIGSVGGSVVAYGVSFAGGSLGDVTNSGSIDVSGLAQTNAIATASAQDDTRVAQQNFANVALTGINIATGALTGPVVNDSTVTLSAIATLESRQTAAYDGAATHTKAKVEASGYLNTQLAGISVFATTGQAAGVSVTVGNSGTLALSARATGSQAALALSDGAAEASLLYSAGAATLAGALLFGTNLAAGISISAPNVVEVTNSGIIDITTSYTSTLTATSGGAGTSAQATANSGQSSFNSFGFGIFEASGPLPSGTTTSAITNSGRISLADTVSLTNAAIATASPSGGAAVASALSQSTQLTTMPGLDGAIAASYGIYASLNGIDGNLTNSGVISVEQALAITGTANAIGQSAQATTVSDGLSLALGVLALPGQVTGSILNSGAITARASGLFNATATASGNSGTAEADAAGIVLASGLIASTGGMGGFSNSADILTSATVTTVVLATGGGMADAAATGVGSALSMGVMLTGPAGISGDFINTATIGATALSNVTASGSGAAVSTGATAVASAFGLLTAAGAGMGGGLVNTGIIGGIASATASGGTADAAAYAYGLALDATGGVGGSIVNSGLVIATASANATGASSSAKAVAVGLQIASGTVGGALANTGAIAAQANGTDATAIGIAIGSPIDGKALGVAQVTTLDTLGVDAALATAGAVTLTDGLVNTGTITATTGTTGSATAIRVAGGSSIGTLANRGGIYAIEGNTAGIAIDLTGEGSATRVLLQDGSVYGDLALSSTYADAITWSGGTLNGDMLGGGLGSLTVLAGVDASFTYSGTMESLATINVGGNGAPVSLAFTGTASDIGTFAVKDQGTLILTSDSAIETRSYTQSAGGTLGVYLAPQWTAAPIVATSAQLDGTVAVLGASGLRAKTTSYDLVASSDISGTFADVTTPNSLLSAAVTYDADGATLVLTRNATTSLAGLSLAGRSLAAGIDLNYQRLSLSSPLSPVLDSFYSDTDGQVTNLLNQMSGAPLADAKAAGMATFGTINGQISQQLAATRGTGALPSGGSALLSYGSGAVSLSGNAYAATASASDASSPWAALSPAAAMAPQNGVWLRPFGNWGSYDTGNGTTTSSGGGVLGGIERAFGDDARGGAVFSYQTANLGFTTPASGSVDQWTASLYAEKQWGAFYANLFGTYGYQTYDMSRSIGFGGQLFTARSNFSGNAGAVVGEAGYDYAYAPGAKLEPYLRLAYAALATDTFAERGAGVFNLNVAGDTTQSLQSTLGLRVIQPLSLSTVPVTLRLEAGWQHEYLDTGASLGAAFLSDSTISFNILSGGPSDLALAAAGLSFAFSANLDGYIEYRGSFGDGTSNSTASAQLRLRF